ncbi:cell division protein SepF [Saccharopolyspora sp. NPDC000995]
MNVEEAVFFIVQALGPSLILLVATTLALLLIRKVFLAASSKSQNPGSYYPVPIVGASHDLGVALDEAVALNSFNGDSHDDPAVRLQQVVRFKPSEYQAATREVLNQFRNDRVVSIDLRSMNPRSAARLVDFSSGIDSRSFWLDFPRR